MWSRCLAEETNVTVTASPPLCSSASVTSLQQWQHMRDASAEASAWNDLQALARGYGYTWSVQQDLSGRLIGELWAGPRRYARVSAPSRVVAVEMLVAWLEANS